jgi:nucleotide-binding universal stress UspA family protein
MFVQHIVLVQAIFINLLLVNIVMFAIAAASAQIWTRVLRVPEPLLMGGVVVMVAVGTFSVNNSLLDLGIAFIAGLVGFLLRYNGFPTAPVVIGLVLGRMVEESLRMGLIAYDGSPSMKKAIDEAVQGKLLQGLKLHLLTVGTPRPAVETELEAARLRLGEAGYAVTAEHATGAVETVIAEQVARQGIDLLITGAYGHSRIRHLIIGSTTSTLIRTVTKPVLIFR